MYEEILEYASSLACTVRANEPMKKHISFKVGGTADVFIEPESLESLMKIMKKVKSLQLKCAVIGNGSNLLIPDEGYRGVIIHLGEKFGKIELVGDDTIFAEAGASLMKVCTFALENELSGLEFAYGIPGSAGGAAFMNAGAYGGEMKDVINKCTHIDSLLNYGELSEDELDLAYRHSAYSDNGYVITGVYIKLKKADKAEIKAKMSELYQRRKDKQPLEYPSAGSTFKRPEGMFAGKLIDECGLRGKSIGGAMVSEKHAGFVINYCNASCKDILELCEAVSTEVRKRFGVSLEKEVRVLR